MKSFLHGMFHPTIAGWFEGTLGLPTDIQQIAWPKIADSEHVLITAPTGSGKTLTAFLWAIHQLMTGVWPGGQVRVIYVSPSKALNNDVQKNLIQPLSELQERFEKEGRAFCPVRVLTRSGDTPQSERRGMLKHPPEILITTPETLNILISSINGRKMLTGVCSVILDEIHAVAGSKRGTHLMTAVDRLVPLCGEFQRIALSATVRPLKKVADFVGGYEVEGDFRQPVYRKRRVVIVESTSEKKVDVSVRFPENAAENLVDGSRWPFLAGTFRDIIRQNRSTLLFANSRRLTEKITRLINEQEGDLIAYAHHGSLSKEIRLAVEQNLKIGKLKAIVATNSLELGIDIGQLDQVILVQTPPTVSSAVQRIGRSGHRVGLTSRGLLFPTHGRDFLNAAVMARCIREKDIEPVSPVICPLDVLAQLIVSMTCVETWDVDHLFSFIRAGYAFHELSRKNFDQVLEMLEGRYAETRIRELRPKVSIDRTDNTIRAKDGMKMMVYMAGGTIPDRGYYNLRVSGTRAKIGELDEEFVWERKEGDTFALGTRTWRIEKITHNDIEVVGSTGNPGIIPFWKAEAGNRDFSLSEKIGLFLQDADTFIGRGQETWKKRLTAEYGMEEAAADELIGFLERQKEFTGSDLPHRYHILIEHFDDPLNQRDSKQVVLHTVWGGRINQPFAIALSAAWEKKYAYPLEVFSDDDAILLLLPHSSDMKEIFSLVRPDDLESLLRAHLPKTGYFGARFRENAGRALLLPKAGFHKRMPLWLNRLRSKKLLDAALQTKDFPMVLETWRTCIRDDFDPDNLKKLLYEIQDGKIRISQVRSFAPSPFAANLIWQQTNKHMYEDDTPFAHDHDAGISHDMIREIMGDPDRARIIPGEIFRLLHAKLQRTASGYSPATPRDLLDWLKERLVIPEGEWQELLHAMKQDHGLAEEDILLFIGTRAVRVRFPEGKIRLVCAIENLPVLAGAFSMPGERLMMESLDPDDQKYALEIKKNMDVVLSGQGEEETASVHDFLSRWLSFYGPVPEVFVQEVFGFSDDRLPDIVSALIEADLVVRGKLREEIESVEICDRENFEILLRMARRARQPVFQPLSLNCLPLFLASFQGLAGPGNTLADLQERMDQLFGLCLPAAAWEEDILPARLHPYQPLWLDNLLQTSSLMWFGCGEKKIGFSFEEDRELFASASEPDERSDCGKLLPRSNGRFGLFDIMNHSGLDSEKASREIWKQVWAGKLTNDTFLVLREGILNRFTPAKAVTGNKGRRGGYNRWKTSRPMSGTWSAVQSGRHDPDPMEMAEIRKDRARQLFRRYGIVFRELLSREIPELTWGALFRTLRNMELSGEILSGQFFEDISGLQFISHEAFRLLQEKLPEDAVYWMSAVDPASICGMISNLPAMNLPPRRATTHLVFHGIKPVLVSKSSGRHLTFFVPPDDPHISRYLGCFTVFLTRGFHPARCITVETVNDEPVKDSPYADPLQAFGFTREYKGFELRRRFD
ncbi:MAG: DEAD/DEAH box helicase [Pseudomonadota bacterium]